MEERLSIVVMLEILVLFKYLGLLVKPGDEKIGFKVKRLLNSSKKLLYFEVIQNVSIKFS